MQTARSNILRAMRMKILLGSGAHSVTHPPSSPSSISQRNHLVLSSSPSDSQKRLPTQTLLPLLPVPLPDLGASGQPPLLLRAAQKQISLLCLCIWRNLKPKAQESQQPSPEKIQKPDLMAVMTILPTITPSNMKLSDLVSHTEVRKGEER